MARFAENLDSFFDFKQQVLRGVGSRAVSVLTNESFKRKVFVEGLLSEYEDAPDNAKPAMSPALIRDLHTPSFDPLQDVACGAGDIHNETAEDPFIAALYKNVLGISHRG